MVRMFVPSCAANRCTLALAYDRLGFAVASDMRSPFKDVIKRRVAALEAQNLLRHQRVVHQDPQRVLCSNDYLGLAGDGSLLEPSPTEHSHADSFRSGSGASRLISGTHKAHVQLEQELAAWLGAEAAIYFATGYQANVGLMSALGQRGDVIFSDALNHASIIDGIRLSKAQRVIYPHNDMAALEQAIQNTPAEGLRILVTDAIFSMDGDAARLHDLVRLKRKYNAVLIVDEAHAIGVLGEQGRGLSHAMGVANDVDVIVGPCGKAFGSTGAFIACSELLRTWLYNRARSFVYSTAPPPWAAEYTRRALPFLIDGARQRALQERMQYFARLLEARGFWEGTPVSPIFPVVVGPETHAIALAQALDDAGIFVHPIRPPTVAEGSSRLRVTVTAVTPLDVLERFVEVLDTACQRLNLQPQCWSHGKIQEK